MMKGQNFSTNKFSEFILDKSKKHTVKLVLLELENYGMQLQYCWEHSDIDITHLSRKEKVVSYLISIGDIYTFKDLIDAFEPNGLNM